MQIEVILSITYWIDTMKPIAVNLRKEFAVGWVERTQPKLYQLKKSDVCFIHPSPQRYRVKPNTFAVRFLEM